LLRHGRATFDFEDEPAEGNEVLSSDSQDWTPLVSDGSARAGESQQKLNPRLAADDPQTKVAATEPSAEKWNVTRGHGLTFVGLFLFTVVLYFRPYELFPSLSWLSTSAFWLAGATLLVFIPTQLGLEGTITARPREVNLILLLVLTALLSIPLAVQRSAAWFSFTEYLKVVVMFIVMVNVVRTEKRLKVLIVLVLGVSCILGVAAINDYRVGNLGPDGSRISGVIGGLFGNPNDLALHLVTMIPLAVGLLFATRNPITKVLYLLCSLLMLGGIIATFSRGGVLGVACAILVLMWKLSRRGRIVFAVVGILTIVVLAPGIIRSRLGTTQDASAIARTDDLKRSLFLTVRHPVFGIGMGNYVYYSNRAKATHNAYTQVASELGVVAGVCYLLFVIAPLKPLRRIERENLDSKRKPPVHYLAIALQASLAGYMVSSFFASVAYAWYVYYLVGYAVCLRRIHEMNKQTQSK
jgi:hypothetical protein